MDSAVAALRRWSRRQASQPDVDASRLGGLLHTISRLAINLMWIRVLSAVGLVVALWLCPVEIFAHLGLYLAAVNLAVLAVFGRHELLVVAAHDERKCADAFHLCLLAGGFAIAASFLAAIAMQHLFVSHVTLIFAGSLLVRAWLRLGLTLATRHGRYDRAVKALVPHAIGQPLTLVWLIYEGHDPFLAFVLADFVGQLIAAACVCIGEWRAFRTVLRERMRLRKIAELARANLSLPTLNLPAAASALLFATTPLFFLPTVQNAVLAGTLALLFRLLDVATNLTSASMNPILTKEVADRNRDGTLWFSRGTFLLPAAIAVVVFGSIALAGLALDQLGLAPNWHMALALLPVVALFQASIAATLPLIDIATMAGRQRGLFALNIVCVALAGAALLLWHNDPVFAILMAGMVGFARVIVMSLWLAGSNVAVPAK